MTRKKDAPALFEVIAKGEAQQTPPDAAYPGLRQAPRPPGSPPEVPLARPAGLASAAPPRPLPVASAGVAAGPYAPMSDKLSVALSPVGWTVLGALVLLALVGAYFLGRSGASGPAPAPAGSAADRTVDRSGGPTPAIVTPDGGAAGTGPGGRQPGKYYLVIQGMQGMTSKHQEDAQSIVEFLGSMGVRSTVGIYRGRPQQYIVWSLDPFDRPTDLKAKEYARKIEDIAKQYRVPGGYKFTQGSDPWFLQCPSGGS